MVRILFQAFLETYSQTLEYLLLLWGKWNHSLNFEKARFLKLRYNIGNRVYITTFSQHRYRILKRRWGPGEKALSFKLRWTLAVSQQWNAWRECEVFFFSLMYVFAFLKRSYLSTHDTRYNSIEKQTVSLEHTMERIFSYKVCLLREVAEMCCFLRIDDVAPDLRLSANGKWHFRSRYFPGVIMRK